MYKIITLFLLFSFMSYSADLHVELKTKKSFTFDKKHANDVIEAMKKLKAKKMLNLPRPKEIHAELILTNNSNKNIDINIGGDNSYLIIKLEGDGAITTNSGMMMTMDFRMGKNLTIKPGAKHVIPVPSLAHGKRGFTTYSYWTKPGVYELAVSYKSGNKVYSSKALKVKVE